MTGGSFLSILRLHGVQGPWVAHTNAVVVVEIDLESWKIVRLLEAGREPDGMAYSTLDVDTD